MTLLSDEQIKAAREQNGVQKLICITIDRTVDALAQVTGGQNENENGILAKTAVHTGGPRF